LDYQRIIDSYTSKAFDFELSELDKIALEGMWGGKRLRAVLTLLWCEAYGGDATMAAPVAVAYELAHGAALIQDDIIDNSSFRRGEMSLVAKHGLSNAILASNALLFLVPKMISRFADVIPSNCSIGKLLDLLGDCCHSTTNGEFLDLQFTGLEEVHEEDYLEMIKLKTGALVAASSASGALVGAGPENAQAIHRAFRYGECIGMAYQIQDDLLDIFGDENSLGKAPFTDLRSGKTNLSLIHLFSNCSGEERRFVRSLIRDDPMTDSESGEIKWLLKKYGSFHVAKEKAELYVAKAKSFITNTEGALPRKRLVELTDFLAERIQ
jgi:geranylgeranyl pyrophosphate synthase